MTRSTMLGGGMQVGCLQGLMLCLSSGFSGSQAAHKELRWTTKRIAKQDSAAGSDDACFPRGQKTQQ